MIHLKINQFPTGAYNKLKDRQLGPCKILAKYGDNAYRIKLPDDLYINPVFNIADLKPYYAPNEFQLAE